MLALARPHKSNRKSLAAPQTHSLALNKGFGSAVASRNSVQNVIDFEGLARPVDANVARFEGARVVKNRLVNPVDLIAASGGVWGAGSITAGITDPEGGSSAFQIDMPSANTGKFWQITGVQGSLDLPSIWIKADAAGTIRFLDGVGGGWDVTLNVTANWQRLAAVATPKTSNSPIQFGIYRTNTGQLAKVYVWHPMLETVTGQANQNPSTWINGTYFYDRYNGNTVASGVITEAEGAAIPESTMKGVLFDATGEYLNYQIAGNMNAREGTLCCGFIKKSGGTGDLYLGGSYVDANNSTGIFYTGTQLIFRKRIAGTDYDAAINFTAVVGDLNKLAVIWSELGSQIVINGQASAVNANSSPLQLASTWQVGANGNGTNQPFATIKATKIYKKALSLQKLILMISL
jgi:hypothetical protein